jgi:hypothetical protein
VGETCCNLINCLLLSTWEASNLPVKEAAPVATFNMKLPVIRSKLLVFFFLEHVIIFLNFHSATFQTAYPVRECDLPDPPTGSLSLPSLSPPERHNLHYLHPGASLRFPYNQWHTPPLPFHARVRTQSGNILLWQLRWHAGENHR